MSHWAAVLAGGSGTRFWPLSTSRTPKQLLALAGSGPLLAQAVGRLAGVVPPERTLVLTAASQLDGTRRMLPGLPASNILAEPRPASTGPALAWATLVASQSDPDASLLSLHADWYVGDDAAFRETAKRALNAAERYDRLMAVGMTPSRPEIGYGYIVPGQTLGSDVRAIARFVEKPDATLAARLIAEGALWNCGLFAWTARRFFLETDAVAPEIGPHLRFLRNGEVNLYFQSVQPVAVDVSHFERSAQVGVIPGHFPWDDVGTWAALARVRPLDGQGNTLVGKVKAVASSGSVAWSEDDPLVLFGVDNLVVVRAHNVVLVTTTERAGQLKELLEALPASLRDPKP